MSAAWRGGAWTEERGGAWTEERGGAWTEERGGAWTEERSDEGRRRTGASRGANRETA